MRKFYCDILTIIVLHNKIKNKFDKACNSEAHLNQTMCFIFLTQKGQTSKQNKAK